MTACLSSLNQTLFQEDSLTLAGQHPHVNPSDYAHVYYKKNEFATEVLFFSVKNAHILIALKWRKAAA